jgi:hypothetical protein
MDFRVKPSIRKALRWEDMNIGVRNAKGYDMSFGVSYRHFGKRRFNAPKLQS